MLVVCIAFPLSYALTFGVREYALRAGILDVPNARSSHNKVTPRGGGLSIALIFMSGTLALAMTGHVPGRVALALLGGGLAVATAGWIDDRVSLPARTRALVHFAAAAWALYWLKGFPTIRTGLGTFELGWLGTFLAAFGIVWLTNLYNFMDGIDGIAGIEAITVGAVGGLLEYMAGATHLAVVSWLLASACAGFLVWNWPPAKVFMGDVGSGLLGFTFAVLAIASERLGGTPLISWMMLLGVFVVDATVTLFRRVIRGERWHQPHRSHAYQLAVQSGHSHLRVTLSVFSLNVVLGALAIIGHSQPAYLLGLVLAAILGLIGLHTVLVTKYSGAPEAKRPPQSLTPQ